MRQRKVKDLDEKMEALSKYLIAEPKALRGHWKEYFGNDGDIYLELGCGKGQFLSTYAEKYPDRNYIGIEGQDSVILRALEKAERLDEEKAQRNIAFACEFVQDIGEYFAAGELAGVYLNFSDPWPKARHAKRRLTYGGRLVAYAGALAPGGCIEIKTDNNDLFDFTLSEIERTGFTVVALSRDLHGSAQPLEAAAVHTEYEDKFTAGGKNINYVKIYKPLE